MKHVLREAVFLGLAVLTLGSCAKQSSPVAAQPSCCIQAETPAAFTDKSIYQTESTWTTDQGKQIKLSALAGRPEVVVMFFANCQFACPIIVNDMKLIEAALPPQLQSVVGFTLVSFDSKRDTPAALAEYRRTRDLPRKSWTLMQGRPDDVLELAALLGVKFKENAVGQFAHSNIITILNAKGEIVHQQVGLNQDIQETVRLLGELVKRNRN
jgi:protein SCO1/2